MRYASVILQAEHGEGPDSYARQQSARNEIGNLRDYLLDANEALSGRTAFRSVK